MSHPIVEIAFELVALDDPEQVVASLTRYWYHVPRVGDFVTLTGIAGFVRHVNWTDEGVGITLSVKEAH